MKLAEALIKRSDVQKRIKQLKHRLNSNATVQEGLSPADDPQALLAEAGQAVRRSGSWKGWSAGSTGPMS